MTGELFVKPTAGPRADKQTKRPKMQVLLAVDLSSCLSVCDVHDLLYDTVTPVVYHHIL